MSRSCRFLLLIPITLGLVVGRSACRAGPVVTVGANVAPAARVPVQHIDHGLWNDLLSNYVDSSGMVDYAAWKRSAADQQNLERYLLHLSSATFPRDATRAARLAYWINAYNALTVYGILREYPTTSIRNHTPRLFGYHIWKDLHLTVEGRGYSLEDIEHKVLRNLGDPRIHFAIVCASKGCPPLRNEAYTANELERQLADNARVFFADRQKFQYDTRRGTIAVSPILDWFAEDFGADQQDQLRRIASYLPTDEARRLAESGRARLQYLDYDWSLNDQHQ